MTVPDIHRGVLDNLLDGVLVVGPGGRIETLNPAAERILGLGPGEAADRGFGELFVTRDGFDDFTQLVLDATAQQSGPERRVVEVRDGGGTRSLSVATSYLKSAGERADSGSLAVIAVFSDISELRELRETELRMAKAAEAQHGKLQDAYREIEQRNSALAAALRKVRIVQGVGTVLVFGLFLGAGLWTWRPLDLFADIAVFGSDAGAATSPGDGSRSPRTMTVNHSRNSSSITLKGRLSPWREAVVTSPVQGTVAAVDVEMGQRVEKDQVLLRLDLSDLERKYESRRLSFLRAREQFETVADWEESAEMVKARRSFTKAQMNMESRRVRMRKSRFLYEQGLVPATEFEDEEREYKSQLLDFETSREELAAVRAKGDDKALAAAKLAMENARATMLAAKEAIRENAVRAPFAGTVLPPAQARKNLVAGVRVRHGDALFRIGDFSRVAAKSTVDEIDVFKLKAGQKVTVTGNAFPSLKLSGVVKSVSAEADPKKTRKPVFDIHFLLDKLGAAAQARIRPGMSAKLRIVTYSNPKALMVPLDAVRRRGGKYWLKVLDPGSGQVQDRQVTIGPTTLRRVEIASGLKPGELVVLPGG